MIFKTYTTGQDTAQSAKHGSSRTTGTSCRMSQSSTSENIITSECLYARYTFLFFEVVSREADRRSVPSLTDSGGRYLFVWAFCRAQGCALSRTPCTRTDKHRGLISNLRACIESCACAITTDCNIPNSSKQPNVALRCATLYRRLRRFLSQEAQQKHFPLQSTTKRGHL